MSDLPDGSVYVIPPIAYWLGWATEETAVPRHEDDEVRESLRTQIEETLEHAISQIRERSGWDGDIDDGPYFGGLPPNHHGSESDVIVAIKQLENGNVFIWSPHRLQHLDQYTPEHRSPPRSETRAGPRDAAPS